ncbi:MAG: aldehyde dehydrogenase family protein, partial [Candidatus Nanopelagicales bacterium]
MTIEYPVAGRWTSGESSREVRSPFDDAVIAQIPSFSAADVDAAVEVAQTAMRQAPLATHERAAILDRAAVLLAERLEDIAAD